MLGACLYYINYFVGRECRLLGSSILSSVYILIRMQNFPGSSSRMDFRIDWIFPSLRKPYLFWNIASSLTVAAVGLFSKLLVGKLLVL